MLQKIDVADCFILLPCSLGGVRVGGLELLFAPRNNRIEAAGSATEFGKLPHKLRLRAEPIEYIPTWELGVAIALQFKIASNWNPPSSRASSANFCRRYCLSYAPCNSFG